MSVPRREFYQQAARASWAVSVVAVLLLTCSTPLRVKSLGVAAAALAVSGLLFLTGLAMGAFAVSGIRQYGRQGIANNAFVGIALSGLMLVLVLIASGILPGRPAGPPVTRPAATTTQSNP